jgi:hypothetical protein
LNELCGPAGRALPAGLAVLAPLLAGPWLPLLAVTAACRPTDAGQARAAGVVDSVVPIAVALARFRERLPEPAGLAGDASSRDALIRRLIAALEASDTAAAAALTITPAEFAWLYYPTAREALPPYELSPALMWFMLEGRSRDGLLAALREFGGRPFGYRGHTCGAPRTEGANRIWGYCRVRHVLPDGRSAQVSLFGLMLEREGRYKFVSLANKL